MKPKLLIVDDSRVSRMMIRGRVGEMQPNWDILEAASGNEGVEIAVFSQPDFITMDVNMPDISGFEAVAQIRQAGSRAKIVILTANIQESSREKARLLDVQFVQKPATEAALQQAIDYFLAPP